MEIKEPIKKELLDELLKDYKTSEDILGQQGLLKQFTKQSWSLDALQQGEDSGCWPRAEPGRLTMPFCPLLSRDTCCCFKPAQ